MAQFQFPDVYQWISDLPPPSLWSSPSVALPLGDHSLELIAERTEDGCASFFITDSEEATRHCLNRDMKWNKEEESEHNNSNMQVITSPLLSFAIASISHAIHYPHDGLHDILLNYGIHLGQVEVAEDSSYDHSITQSSNFPLIFNSAFACMCILTCPPLILDSSVSKFISPNLALANGVHFDIGPLTRIFGSFFTYRLLLRDINAWEPLSWSYARNTCDPCEIQIYCPLVSMVVTHSNLCHFPETSDGGLRKTLAFQQVECIVQLRYDLTFKGKCIHLHLGIHNVRCDIRPYENLPLDMAIDLIRTEKYFPSKLSITIAPQHPSSDLNISVNRSSANPTCEIATGNSWETSYQAPKDFGVKASASTSSSRSISSWEFEASAEGVKGTCQWILHDSSNVSGTKVISSKPSRVPFYKSKTTAAWYRDRYSKAANPFNERGGVVFASDQYGKAFTWTLNRSMECRSFKCKIEGTVWVTYWPNLYSTSFYESRYHKFSEIIELPLTEES